MRQGRSEQGLRRLLRMEAMAASLRRVSMEAGCPLGRLAFLLVCLGETGLGWLLWPEDEGLWLAALGHGALAWGAVALCDALLEAACARLLRGRAKAKASGAG